jgi:hypothetical protein
MTRVQLRRLAILTELVKLSKDGWANARPCDYEPLEAELRSLAQPTGKVKP